MLYKDYGTTGNKVSAVGFGGMRFDLEQGLESNSGLVRYAFDQGITYFDTAPGYCDGQSEIIYGEAFKKMPRDKIFVSTKCMPANSPTVEKTIEAVKNSIQRMGCEYIDFYHVWCIRQMEHYEDAVRPGAQYDGLLKCQEMGLVKNIVFSSHQKGDEIKKILDTGKFKGVLLGANVLNFPYRWEAVETAYESGYGVVAMNPLAGGEIPRHEKELDFLCTEGLNATESALRFLICCPQITVTLNGFTTREHVDTACGISDNCNQMSLEEIAEIQKHLGSRMDSVCTGCGYCKDCPQDINVPGHMQVYNEHHLYGKDDEAMTKQLNHEYNWGRLVGMTGDYAKCIECGACESACTQHLPIIKRLKDFAKWQPEDATK